MTLHHDTLPPVTRMLKAVSAWLDKAQEHATAKKFDVNTLFVSRLAPDQYPLGRQIQAACDAGKFLAARLAAKEAPKHPDTETTLEEFKARIASCVQFVESISEADVKGAESRVVPLGFMPGKGLKGADYAFEMALPNFYFHATHTYAILRHNGVPLGKMDYIGSLSLVDV
jgi:hypothetical protein